MTNGETIILGDGKEYKLGPVTLETLAALERKFGNIGPAIKARPLQMVMYLLYLMIRDNYPNLTETQVGRLVSLETVTEVGKLLIRIGTLGSNGQHPGEPSP